MQEDVPHAGRVNNPPTSPMNGQVLARKVLHPGNPISPGKLKRLVTLTEELSAEDIWSRSQVFGWNTDNCERASEDPTSAPCLAPEIAMTFSYRKDRGNDIC